jgi:hypothetical protein
MKNLIYILIFCGIAFSCKSKNEKIKDELKAFSDSMRIAEMADSMSQDLIQNSFFDTTNQSTAPVQVLKSWLPEKEYSSYKDLSLRYKNISKKKIEAIKFRWYGVNAFGDPADMGGSFQEGFGGGFTDDALNPGAVRSSTWNILSRNAKKVVKAWPIEVMFSDGTKWKSQ